MRLEYSEPKNESDFYQNLKRRTEGEAFYERIEPSNESGFPDIHFVWRDNVPSSGIAEGTIELKYERRKSLDLKTLVNGNQKSALIEYYQAGGRRRYALCYHARLVYIWNTQDFYNTILGKPKFTDFISFDHQKLVLWLLSHT